MIIQIVKAGPNSTNTFMSQDTYQTTVKNDFANTLYYQKYMSALCTSLLPFLKNFWLNNISIEVFCFESSIKLSNYYSWWETYWDIKFKSLLLNLDPFYSSKY